MLSHRKWFPVDTSQNSELSGNWTTKVTRTVLNIVAIRQLLRSVFLRGGIIVEWIEYLDTQMLARVLDEMH
jgi:hypothetical protein